MSAASIPARVVPPDAPFATRIAFLIAGAATGAWAPLVTFLQDRLEIDKSTLGLLLLCLGAGSIAAMPLAGMAANRFGCRLVIFVAIAGLGLALPMVSVAPSFVSAALALLLLGASVGALDCVMNIQAIIVERDRSRPMMSGFHGLYSVGGFAGAAAMTGLLWQGASPWLATWLIVAAIGLAAGISIRGHLPFGSASTGPAFAMPRGIVLFLGILAAIVFLAEGAVLDWSAVFLVSVRGADAALAGLGFAVFATTMTIGRLTGDAIVARLGPRRIITGGGLLAAVGFAVATLAPSWEAALAGYALIGAGCSNIVPVLFTAIGRQTDMPEHLAVPAVTTLGYAGILAGPSVIGFVAEATSLQAAFLLLGAGLVAVAASGLRFRA